jgi:hypothetical protein
MWHPLSSKKLALTSPTCSGHLVGLVRSRTQATEFSFFSSKKSMQFQGLVMIFSFWQTVMWRELHTKVRSCWLHTQPPSWRTTPHQLALTSKSSCNKWSVSVADYQPMDSPHWSLSCFSPVLPDKGQDGTMNKHGCQSHVPHNSWIIKIQSIFSLSCAVL